MSRWIAILYLLTRIYFVSSRATNTSLGEGSLTEFSKCCPIGETLSENGKTCIKSDLPFEPVFWGKDPPPQEVGLIIGLRCKFGRYLLEPYIDSNDEFKLITNGSLYVPYHTVQILSPNEYCLESFETPSGEVMVLPLICFAPLPAELSWKEIAMKLYSAGCIISIPFLLLTLLVYTCSPHLRVDINSKVLSCHVACLTVAYTSLSMVQLFGSVLSSTVCILVAFCIQFSFLASFFWLNVLCFNTWQRLRKSCDPVQNRSRRQKSKRFLYYSVYAWSVPIFFVGITLAMDMSPSVPSSYLKPNFGIDTCWFREDTTALPYFYAPMALIIFANLIMFIMSAFSLNRNCKTQPQTIKRMREAVIMTINQQRKKVFVECLILFLVMGLNWAFEVISWAIGGPPQLWFVTDLFNTLQGTIVFYVFVYREIQARQALVSLLKCKMPKDVTFNGDGNPLHSNGYSPAPTSYK